MRKTIVRGLLSICLSAGAFSAFAQPAIPREYIEFPGYSVGFNFGLADLWGDVGTKSVIDHYTNGKYFDNPTFMGGVFARVTAHPSFATRIGVNYGTLYANDNWNEDKAKKAKNIDDDYYQRYLRNQDARANVWEGSLIFEIIPLRMNSESRSAAKRMQPYLALGVAGFAYKPQTSLIDRVTYKKTWVNTKDLHLEGEDFEFSKATPHHSKKSRSTVLAIPLGLGLRWDLSENIAFGVEYLFRYTTTDRLDNVSSEYATPEYFDAHLSPEKAAIAKEVYDKSWAIEPSVTHDAWSKRGNKEVKDSYSTISFMLIYKLKTNKMPWWY